MDSRIEEGGEGEPEAVAEALTRVQQAVSDVATAELRESLEAAVEAIDATSAEFEKPERDKLAATADALEGALDELEHGKVANLQPVIEQAQSVVASGSSEV